MAMTFLDITRKAKKKKNQQNKKATGENISKHMSVKGNIQSLQGTHKLIIKNKIGPTYLQKQINITM